MKRLTCCALVLWAELGCAQTSYPAADGTRARRPHQYRRHPNQATAWTGKCRDGSVTFAHRRQGACSRHGGVQNWHEQGLAGGGAGG